MKFDCSHGQVKFSVCIVDSDTVLGVGKKEKTMSLSRDD